jgi:hypothetical protein
MAALLGISWEWAVYHLIGPVVAIGLMILVVLFVADKFSQPDGGRNVAPAGWSSVHTDSPIVYDRENLYPEPLPIDYRPELSITPLPTFGDKEAGATQPVRVHRPAWERE